MTLRRYTPLKPSRGTVIPSEVREAVWLRDKKCVCARAGFPAQIVATCSPFALELDHVRASGAMGKKSRSTPDNLVLLHPEAHRWKTANGRLARPLLIRYLERESA